MALKMGLSRAPLSLNYPCASLARMLGVPAGPQAVKAALDAFFAARTSLFGAVQVEAHEDGFCLTIPAEGVARVVSQAPAAAFLRDLIHTAQLPGATAEDLLAAFRRHSSHVHVEPVDNDELTGWSTLRTGCRTISATASTRTTALPAITAFPGRLRSIGL